MDSIELLRVSVEPRESLSLSVNLASGERVNKAVGTCQQIGECEPLCEAALREIRYAKRKMQESHEEMKTGGMRK